MVRACVSFAHVCLSSLLRVASSLACRVFCVLYLAWSVLSVACCGFARLSCLTEGAVACKLGSWGLLHLRTLLPCPYSAAPTSLLLACTLQTSSTQRSTSVASCWGWRVRSPTRQFHTSRAARQQHAAPRCVGSLQRGAVSLSFHLPLAAHPPQAVSDTTCHCLPPLHGRRRGSRLPTHCCRSGIRRAREAAPAAAKSSSR